MRLTPRQDEIAAVVAILEDESHKDAQACAKAVIKEVARQLEMRDTWALAVKANGNVGLNLGPFFSTADAAGFASKLETGGVARVVPISSIGQVLADRGERQAKGNCQDEKCWHPTWLHLMDGSSYGKCGLSNCPCTKFKKEK